MTDVVPIVTSFEEIYHDEAVSDQRRRWELLLAVFKKEYGEPAQFISRSPGRVNLIGEHIDYSLYEVLPMAVTADMLIAVRVHPASTEHDRRVRITNVNKQRFRSSEFVVPSTDDITIDADAHDWTNYFKSGLRGALSYLRKRRLDQDFLPRGMDVLVDGTVPIGGGLSSSAAFVCASAIAVLKANGENQIDKTELVEVAIVSERAVGVYSGGMDQSASLFARSGSALYVSFKPSLCTRPVQLPSIDPSMVFVIAQSFVAADKHDTAPLCYNLRVVECALAAEVLARKLGSIALPKDAGPLGVSLRGLHDAYFEKSEGIADNLEVSKREFAKQLQILVRLTEKTLSKHEGYSREEISDVLHISVDELNKRYMSKFSVRAERFMLRQRALHVYTEAARVLSFMEILEHPPNESEDLLRKLGSIMNETQESCRTAYDCSCVELDELCSLARSAGAYGSRLTGAGWGGCSVHLMAADKVDEIKQVWIEKFYKKRFPDMTEEKLAEAIVVSKPGSGSCIFDLTASPIT